MTQNNTLPTISHSAWAVINMASASRHILATEMGSLRQRKGDVKQQADRLTVWLRYLKDNHHLTGHSENSLHRVQTGIEFKRGSWLLGAVITVSDTSIQSGSVNNGNIKNQSSEFYTTWLDNSGIYWDNMLNLHYFNQYVHTQMHSGKTTKGQYQQYSVSVASDVGHSLSLSPGMTATPYGKISFFHTRKTDDELDNQMIAALPPASGMDGEMGILVAADFICPANACAPILSPPYHMNLPGIVE